MPNAILHDVLDAERQAQSLSYAELARRAGLPHTTTYDILVGRRPDPQWSIVLALLAGLGRSLKWTEAQGIRVEEKAEKSPQ